MAKSLVPKTIDTIADSVQSTKNITKADYVKSLDILKAAGRNTEQASTVLSKITNEIDIKRIIEFDYVKDYMNAFGIKDIKSVWDLPPVIRGKVIDDCLNQHTIGGLGRTFPVVDRLESATKTLVSTKSIDLGLKTYQSPSKLKSVINRYAKKLNDFEKDWIENAKKGFNGTMTWKSDGTETILSTTEYLKGNKVLEIVIPDYKLNNEITKALDEIVDKWKGKIKISFLVL